METQRPETPLLPHHREQLEDSGVSAEVYTARGVHSVTERSELDALGFGQRQANVPALVFPTWNARGFRVGCQVKPDDPRIAEDGRAMKYESPFGSTPVVDCHPFIKERLGNAAEPLLVTEGAKKSDSAVSRGLCCVSLQGVWCWRGKNADGDSVPLADWNDIALPDRLVYVVFDSDVTRKPQVREALVKFVEFLRGRGATPKVVFLPEGEEGQKVGLDEFLASGKTAEDLVALVHDLEDDDVSGAPPTYEKTPEGLVRNKRVKDGYVRELLTNFVAEIKRETILDDGRPGCEERVFEIAATVGGREVVCSVPHDEFVAMNWPLRRLGSGAIVAAGFGLRDHARAALQSVSHPETTTVFCHSGWRLVGDKHVFLHGRGAIGEAGSEPSVCVQPERSLRRYAFPDPPTGEALRSALVKSLGFLDVAHRDQTWPLFAAVLMAPLCEILGGDFVLWLQGSTGSRKSTTAALALCFFGEFTRDTLPANVKSTANAAEKTAHAAKDLLIVFDDYNPAPDRRTRDLQDATVHRIIRAVGDHQGRERMTPRLTLVGEMPPRGLVAVTAELPPPGSQSTESRCFEVVWENRRMNMERLTKAQRDDAPHYAAAMAGYVSWLAPRLTGLRETLADEVRGLRDTMPANHGRLQETGAKLLAGVGLFTRFCAEAGAISDEDGLHLREEAATVLRGCVERTNQQQEDRQPVRVFLETLRVLFLQGKAYLKDSKTDGAPADHESWGWKPGFGGGMEVSAASEHVGWLDREMGLVRLLPDPAIRAVARAVPDEVGVLGPRALGESLRQAGLLVAVDHGRTQKTVKQKKAVRVWLLQAADLIEDRAATAATPATDASVSDDDPNDDGPGPGGGTPPPTDEEAQTPAADPTTTPHAPATAAPVAGVAVVAAADDKRESPTGSHTLVASAAGVMEVATFLEGHDGLVGLDLETTGLDPRACRVRLLSLRAGDETFVVDCFATDPRPLFPALQKKTALGHNLQFDLSFLWQLGFRPGLVADTMLMAQLLTAGEECPRGHHTLEALCSRHLGFTLEKVLQTSDWSQPDLSPAQLRYAALDAEVLPRLHARLHEELAAAGLVQAADLEHRCLPSVVWTACSGAAFDEAAWRAAHEENLVAVNEAKARLDAVAGPEAAGINWSSPVRVRSFFREVGIDLPNTEIKTLARQNHPVATALVAYRKAKGATLKTGSGFSSSADGRIFPSWRQIGACTGRMSCAKPNLQGIPRDDRYRRCFAPAYGRVAIKADYSQIEARIAARHTNDASLMRIFATGEDLYAATAKAILQKDAITKEDRQLAKAITLGLIYGMGAPRLREYARESFDVDLTDGQATSLRDAFFRAYPGLRAWHGRIKLTLRRGEMREARTMIGRRRLLGGQPSFTEITNMPIQGCGADGLKEALALLWQRCGECPDAFPVSVVHDEITVEAPEERAEEATVWLVAAMKDGMGPLLDPVPVVVETSVLRRSKP